MVINTIIAIVVITVHLLPSCMVPSPCVCVCVCVSVSVGGVCENWRQQRFRVIATCSQTSFVHQNLDTL